MLKTITITTTLQSNAFVITLTRRFNSGFPADDGTKRIRRHTLVQSFMQEGVRLIEGHDSKIASIPYFKTTPFLRGKVAAIDHPPNGGRFWFHCAVENQR